MKQISAEAFRRVLDERTKAYDYLAERYAEQCLKFPTLRDNTSEYEYVQANIETVLRNRKRAAARKSREEAYRSCGLVKVRGALGGVYWE